MKTLTAFLVLSLSLQVYATDIGGSAEAAGNYYQSLLNFRNQQMQSMQDNLAELYRVTGGKPVSYNSYSGKLKFEVDEIQGRIANAQTSIDGSSVRVKTDTLNMSEKLVQARARYLNQLKQLDASGTNPESLPRSVGRDLRFVRATKDLNPQEFKTAMKYFEGRTFGMPVNEDTPKDGFDMQSPRQIKIQTYHSQTEVTVRPGQTIKLETATGDLVSGKVVGTYPNGKIIIQRDLPYGLEVEFPELARGRVIDLNEAANVRIYATGSTKPAELSVRYQANDILEAVRQNRLTELSTKPKANGEVAETATVKASIVDKRAGEAIGLGVMRASGASY